MLKVEGLGRPALVCTKELVKRDTMHLINEMIKRILTLPDEEIGNAIKDLTVFMKSVMTGIGEGIEQKK